MVTSVYDQPRLKVAARFSEILGLHEGYLQALEQNPSGDLPYHGNQHQIVVALLCFRGARIHQLEMEEMRAVFLAALFHDYGYDLKETEAVNIAVAKDFAYKLTTELGNSQLSARVVELISETEVPRTEPKSTAASILQDADLLMVSQPDFGRFLIGLSQEQPEGFLNPSFPGEERLNTEWAKRIYATGIELFSSSRKVSDVEQAIAVGNTMHPQALSSKGFLVDEHLREDLEKLWALGYETKFSCGGDIEVTSMGYDRLLDGNIVFADLSFEQFQAVRKAASTVGRKAELSHHADGYEATALRFSAKQKDAVISELLRLTTWV